MFDLTESNITLLKKCFEIGRHLDLDEGSQISLRNLAILITKKDTPSFSLRRFM